MSTSHHNPQPIGASKASVENFACDFADRIGFKPGDSIEALIERMGGELVVGSSGHGDAESGSIVARELDDFTVYISRHTSLKRDRFTIAHELGHLLLHFGAIKKSDPNAVMRATRHLDSKDPKQQKVEWEANWFAAGFLMPREPFSQAYKDGGAEAAARKFGVSLSAAKTRAKALNI